MFTAGLTLLAVRARAAGVPAAAALTYTGYLENPDGSPVTGTKSIGLSLYDAEADGTEVCVQKPADIEPVSGRFQLTLPEKCTVAVQANPDLWLELQVEGSLLGRTKLSAVPYALEAAHASEADAASSAAGDLAKQLAALEARVGPSSGFRALKAIAQPIQTMNAKVVRFDQEVFDLGAEYEPLTGTFKANAAGYYDFQCQITFNNMTSGRAIAHLVLNDTDVAATTVFATAGESGRVAVATLHLAKDDTVVCSAYQDSGSDSALRTDYPYFNVFTGTRISGL